MGLTLVTAPAIEPITVLEAARHIQIGEPSTESRPGSPTVALAASGAGNVENGVHRYRVTFVTADGETDGGDVSEALTVVDKTTNGKVAVSDIPLGSSRVTSRKLYRTTAGGSTYLLLATIADNSTTTYTDNTADASLGVGCPSTNTTDDPFLSALVSAARGQVEERLQRSLITQTWRLTLDAFPCTDVIKLPRPPLQQVRSVTYIDTAGVERDLSEDVYLVDTDNLPGRIALQYGQYWPSTRCQRGAVTIEYVAGYGDQSSDVPAPVLAAMKLILGDLHQHRSAGITGTIHTANPAVDALLGPYRVLEVA